MTSLQLDALHWLLLSSSGSSSSFVFLSSNNSRNESICVTAPRLVPQHLGWIATHTNFEGMLRWSHTFGHRPRCRWNKSLLIMLWLAAIQCLICS